MFGATELIESWCKSIRDRAAAELLSGQPVPGYKVVQGRHGPRRWVDETAAEDALKQLRIKFKDMYDVSLISPTRAEKLYQAGVIGDRQWQSSNRSFIGQQGRPLLFPHRINAPRSPFKTRRISRT
ncbi:DUF2800 domain-containing protein [Xylella fastidiosa subsp. multiplex]|nr:DUF2800 domain-containing protein [Xylella fastidiosa]MDC6416641.1 DUF2800 domain-containing protein [Xylella fastidiosa subsp. multiplex]